MGEGDRKAVEGDHEVVEGDHEVVEGGGRSKRMPAQRA